MPAKSIAPRPVHPLADRYAAVRALSLALAAPLSDADATVQSMEDASPVKWHLAHTTWFFETFVLRDHVTGYALHDERFPFLFNSYYEAEGRRHARDRRGMVTRPTLDEVRGYRAAVDAAVLDALPSLPDAARELVALGCHHEEQHQELLVTDLLHLVVAEPARAGALAGGAQGAGGDAGARSNWIERGEGVVEIGHAGERLRVRLRGAAPPRLARAPRDRRPHGDQRRMGRRSSPTAAIATHATGSPTAGPG